MRIDGARILVTGASGFIGSRLCERLCLEHDVTITALVNTMGHAARIGRLPVKMRRGDIVDQTLMAELTDRADIVLHLAAGGKRVIVQGTRTIASTARRAGVKRFVHMSSAAVYGLTAKEDCTRESAPLKKTGNPYSDVKAQAERIMSREMSKGLSAVILRPRIVWGPWSSWVVNAVEEVQSEFPALVDDGAGICNTVYIDNLVDAIFDSIENDGAVGGTFFVTDGLKLTWRDFYSMFAGVCGVQPEYSSISSEEVIAEIERQPGIIKSSVMAGVKVAMSEEQRTLLKKVPLVAMMVTAIERRASTIRPDRKLRIKKKLGMDGAGLAVSPPPGPSVDSGRVMREMGRGLTDIGNARQKLGYTPRISIEEGLRITTQWLQDCRMIRHDAEHS